MDHSTKVAPESDDTFGGTFKGHSKQMQTRTSMIDTKLSGEISNYRRKISLLIVDFRAYGLGGLIVPGGVQPNAEVAQVNGSIADGELHNSIQHAS